MKSSIQSVAETIFRCLLIVALVLTLFPTRAPAATNLTPSPSTLGEGGGEGVRDRQIDSTLTPAPSDDHSFITHFPHDRASEVLTDPTGLRCVRGISPTPAASRQDALNTARSAALDELLTEVRSQLTGSSTRIGDASLRASIDRLVLRGHLIRQQSVEQFQRPYGDVWQGTVLIDASDRTVASLASAVHRDLNTSLFGHFMRAGIGASLVLTIAGVYLLANGVTRGYFVRPLRSVAILSAASVIGLLMLL